MSVFDRTTLIVLGAGYSTRFGSDKLSADLNGQPLATHLLVAVAPLRFQQKLLVYRGQAWGKRYIDAGFAVLRIVGNGGSQSASLRLGLSRAKGDNVLILLADMPFVSFDHLKAIERIFSSFGGQAVASGTPPQPPAMFLRTTLEEGRLEGDRGARDLLERAISLPADAKVLADIDSKHELEFFRSE